MNTEKEMVLSIIIVNYNVKDFLEQALLSLRRALTQIPSEIIVVDNASVDGSLQMLKQRFPEVKLIENNRNVGFSAANNQGIKIAAGEYIVLLNPDTVVQEDTFSKLLDFFAQNPGASAATCKILNPDGSFSIDCRHSVPTPLTAFWKMIGLNRLFPKSKIFGKYNLTYLDENEVNQVEAVSGSFMMIKRAMVQKVGLLDEDFFMYCEDIDYCYRINQAGGKIFYVPDSQIIHYKGESTKKNNLDYVITFNRSLYLFYKKHYQQKYVYPLKWLILLGTVLRGTAIFFRNNIANYYPIIIDSVLLNLFMFLAFWARYSMKTGFFISNFLSHYIIINVITTMVFVLTALFFYSQNRRQLSISNIIKANMLTFLLVSSSTYFFRQFAFSRFVVLISAIGSPLLMTLWRWLLLSKKKSGGRQVFMLRPTLIVGFDADTETLLRRLKAQSGSGLEVAGIVALKKEDVGKTLASFPVVTFLERLPEYLRLNAIDLVIFTTHQISYKAIFTAMSHNPRPGVEFKMVPGHLEFMVGKSNVERLDAVPLVDIEYNYGRLFNRFIKRVFDLLISGCILLLTSPVALLLSPLLIKRVHYREVYLNRQTPVSIPWIEGKGILPVIIKIWNVFTGRLSLVGAPLAFTAQQASDFDYKPGLSGLVQVNQARIASQQNRENYELHYLKNQSFFLDLEILLRALFGAKQHANGSHV